MGDENPANTSHEQSTEYVLEAIVDERFCETTRQNLYKCRWENYGCADDTWESIDEIGAEHDEMIRWRRLHPELPPIPNKRTPHSRTPGKTPAPKKAKNTQATPCKTPAPKKAKNTQATNSKPRGKNTPAKDASLRKAPKPTTPKAPDPSFAALQGNPDPTKQDISVLKEGSVMWVEYFRDSETAEKQWYKAKVIITR